MLEYEKVKIPDKQGRSTNGEETGSEHESKTHLKFFQEHPSSKIMCMKKRKHIGIPQISSTKIIPNISSLKMGTVNPSDDIKAEREKYAKIALLLFHPFRSRDDLLLNGSFWNKYISSINDENGQFWPKGLEILQNIQDINYNCS